MAASTTMFDMIFLIIQLLTVGVYELIKWILVGIMKFFLIPEVKVVMSVIVPIVCAIIIYKAYKRRGESLYKLRNGK